MLTNHPRDVSRFLDHCHLRSNENIKVKVIVIEEVSNGQVLVEKYNSNWCAEKTGNFVAKNNRHVGLTETRGGLGVSEFVLLRKTAVL